MPGIRGQQRAAHPFRRLVLLLTVALSLALLDSAGLSVLAQLRSAFVTAVSPVQSAAFNFSLPVANFFSDWSTVGTKNEQIAALRAENERLARLLAAQGDVARRAEELDGLLQTAGLGEFKIVMARVMSIGSSAGFGSTILIDAGSEDGLKRDMTVIAGQGMVGRVLSTTPNTAVVVLMVDATSTVGARVAGSGEVGFLSGLGSANTLSLEFIDPNVEVKIGDKLVSYGVAGGVFTAGVPLGTVVRVEAQTGTTSRRADVKPFVDFTSLDLVGIIVQKPRTDPRDSLLPTPTVAPTVTVTVTATPAPAASGASPSPTSTGGGN